VLKEVLKSVNIWEVWGAQVGCLKNLCIGVLPCWKVKKLNCY